MRRHYAVYLKIQCKVISAYEVPHHNNGDNDLIKRKEALQPGSWSTAAPVPRFQTLDPDWSTSPDMSGYDQTSAFKLAQSKTA
ncbi:hypothetical protein T10_11393 [Trichinella papuae]|uniref:Uncharacterized protein n=1 Tax=Trichinella papuae TaxID=268474 RepID=A0A0V1M8A8_9BILA|nr:hypothetical protein T10_11393 [Trichinella papuae]